MNVAEQMVSEIVTIIDLEYPLAEVESLKVKLSYVVSKYQVSSVTLETCQNDIKEKSELFLSAKRLEGLSELTLAGYKLELNIFAKMVELRVVDVTTNHIRSFLGSFKHLKMSSISKKLSVLKSFFGWLTSEEFIQRDPTKKIKPPKKEKRLPKALSIEELEMLREACKTVRQRAFVEVLYATGCRLSEVHDMDRKDINVQSLGCNVIGNGNKEREVYFSFKAMFHVRKYLLSRDDDEEALMVTERRPYRRLSQRGIQREIGIIAKNAGIEKS